MHSPHYAKPVHVRAAYWLGALWERSPLLQAFAILGLTYALALLAMFVF